MNKHFNLNLNRKSDRAKKIFIGLLVIPLSLGSTLSFAEPEYTEPKSSHVNSTSVAYSSMQSLADSSESSIGEANLNKSVTRDNFVIPEELDSMGYEGSGITESEFSDESEAKLVKETMKTSSLKSASRARVRSVLGTDDRVFVPDTTAYPFRVITQILSLSGNNIAGCSGVLIGKDTVLTAGHCLYHEGIWNTNVEVHPGSNGVDSPYGVCSAKSLHVAPEWLAAEDFKYDYGVVKLNCDVGLQTGWLGWHVQTGNMNGTTSYISGYPGDKDLTQWYSIDQIRISGGLRLFFKNDAVEGMSGSPVMTVRPVGSAGCVRACIIAVLSAENLSLPWNIGTRITSQVAADLIFWRDVL
jgi:glutamyl endopeptidase